MITSIEYIPVGGYEKEDDKFEQRKSGRYEKENRVHRPQ